MNPQMIEQGLAEVERPFVVMGIGIPGSGKSAVLDEVAVHLEIGRLTPEIIRDSLSVTESGPDLEAKVRQALYSRVDGILQAGGSVIIDAVNLEAKRRPDDIELYRKYGARAVVAAVFRTRFSDAEATLRSRGQQIPYHRLDKLYRSLRRKPPTLEEGFDKIIE
jgi:predicted kinase